MKQKLFVLFVMSFSYLITFCQEKDEMLFKDPSIDLDKRIEDLMSRLTLEEKIGFLMHDNPRVERLGIKPYSWWGEAGHGVSRNGQATVFPQSIGLAASFDRNLMFRVTTAISDEARAKYNIAQEIGNYERYAGLSFWSPNIEIIRDPRWGRGQETYGEDPFLTGEIAIAYTKGMQGDHPKYLKTAICAKHFAVHSGPEKGRAMFNAEPPLKDLYETYLPAYKAMIIEAQPEIVMCAHSLLYGKQCCGSYFLLQEILRNKWGFQGHVVTDCSNIWGFHNRSKITNTPEESVALAINSGVDMDCGKMYHHLPDAMEQGLVEMATIDKRLRTVLRSAFRLGFFDPPNACPYDTLGAEDVNTSETRALAREAAAKSVVLVKNRNNVLPLDKNAREYYVVGHGAANLDVLMGTYYGTNNDMKTILEGINEKISLGTSLEYKYGFLPHAKAPTPLHYWHAQQMNSGNGVVVCAGISGNMEGEVGETILSEKDGDRSDIMLPSHQVEFIKQISEQGDAPIILIVTCGGPVALGEVAEIADAILYVFYPGEEGGTGVADVLFGDINPAGRLPYTVPKSIDQLPDFLDYSMEGRTYRFSDKEPLYPFGFGLSYTEFEYSDIHVDKNSFKSGDSINVEFTVKNIGSLAGDEVSQLYISNTEADFRVPLYELKEFERYHLKPGESRKLKFQLHTSQFNNVNYDGKEILLPGKYTIYASGSLPSQRSIDLGACEFLKKSIEIKR